MLRRFMISITVAGVALGGMTLTTAHAAWSGGCSTGRVCMWHGNYAASESLQNPSTDNDYSGDYFTSGIPLNDQVKVVHNNIGAGNGVRAYTGAGYSGSASICIPYGYLVGPYPLGVPGGVSSHVNC